MKRTDMLVACEDHWTYMEFRTVFTDGERYFIRWHKEIIDVTKRIEDGDYITK